MERNVENTDCVRCKNEINRSVAITNRNRLAGPTHPDRDVSLFGPVTWAQSVNQCASVPFRRHENRIERFVGDQRGIAISVVFGAVVTLPLPLYYIWPSMDERDVSALATVSCSCGRCVSSSPSSLGVSSGMRSLFRTPSLTGDHPLLNTYLKGIDGEHPTSRGIRILSFGIALGATL